MAKIGARVFSSRGLVNEMIDEKLRRWETSDDVCQVWAWQAMFREIYSSYPNRPKSQLQLELHFYACLSFFELTLGCQDREFTAPSILDFPEDRTNELI